MKTRSIRDATSQESAELAALRFTAMTGVKDIEMGQKR